MAGFVLEDPRFTKASQDPTKQAEDITHAFEAGAVCAPVFISDARLAKLRDRAIITQTGAPNLNTLAVVGTPKGGVPMPFQLVKAPPALPGGSQSMWGVYYDPSQTPKPAANRSLLPLPMPCAPGLTPVMGMVNPANADGKLGVKSTVAGDYDLWCVFPHEEAKDPGINDRAMPLRATPPPDRRTLRAPASAGRGPRVRERGARPRWPRRRRICTSATCRSGSETSART
jgi:hypothetical protein